MPLTGIGSWIPTMQEFEAHWQAVEGGGNAMNLAGSFAITDFQTMITDVDASLTTVVGLDNLRSTAAGDRDIKRAAMRERVRQFRAAVISLLPGSRYLRSMPKLGSPAAGPSAQLKIFDDVKNLWTTINTNSPAVPGFAPPILLAGSYPVATFSTALTAMRAAFALVESTDQNAQQGRAARDELLAEARTRMLQYRQQVVAFLPAGDPLLATVPAVTPAPGSTPPAANLGWVWNLGTDMADLTWTYPDVSRIDHFELRYHPGPRYKASEETAVPGQGAIDKNDTALSTDHTLTATGSVAFFKLYAVTGDGNEKGSNSIKVTRP